MNVRYIKLPDDYEVLAKWWKQHDWPVVPLNYLPLIGLMVDSCAAGFLYKTDSTIAWIEWIVGDGEVDKVKRRTAVVELVKQLVIVAQSLGYKAVFSSTNKTSLKEAYLKCGAVLTDQNVEHFIWNLDG